MFSIFYAKDVLIKNVQFFNLDINYRILDQQLSSFAILTAAEILEQLDRFKDEYRDNYIAPICTESSDLINPDGMVIATPKNNKNITAIYTGYSYNINRYLE